MPVPRLTAVALYVESVRRSAAFYHSALSAAELVEATPVGDYAVLRLGDVELHLYDFAAYGAELHLPGGIEGPKGAGMALYLHVPNLTQAAAAIQRAGGQVLDGPTEQPWGARELLVADPDGYRLVLWQGSLNGDLPTW